MKDIYINSNLNPLTKFTNSSRSTEFKDILPWNIFQIIIPISRRIVVMRRNGASCFEFIGKSMEIETTRSSAFPTEGKAIVEQILASEERSKSKKRAGL